MPKCSRVRSIFNTGTAFFKKLDACKKTNGARLISRRFVLSSSNLFLLILVFNPFQVFAEGLLQVGERFKDCPICPEMIVIPGGELRVESASAEGDMALRILKVPKKFAISIYETTASNWENCEFRGGCKRSQLDNKSGVKDFGWREWKGMRPIVNVTWSESVSYAIWLSSVTGESYWLPTEIEWEYAARSGLVEQSPWLGENKRSCYFGNLGFHNGCSDGYKGSAPVGSYRSNRYGLYDMIGNVSEWTATCSGNMLGCAHKLNRDPVTDDFKLSEHGEVMPGCKAMVYKGVNWSSQIGSFEFSAGGALARGTTTETLGFRVVRLVQ